MEPLSLTVRWQSGRTVHVVLRALPLLGSRERGPGAPAALDTTDVASLAALQNLLKRETQSAPDQGTVELVGFEPAVVKVLFLLDVEGPPPASIAVDLP